MVTLSQIAANSVLKFVKIILGVLNDYLHNQVKLFLNNISIKEFKIIYNNQELASKIWRYILKYIKNLDAILADLKKTDIFIAKAKS